MLFSDIIIFQVKIVVEVRVKDSKGTIQGCFKVEVEIVSQLNLNFEL